MKKRICISNNCKYLVNGKCTYKYGCLFHNAIESGFIKIVEDK